MEMGLIVIVDFNPHLRVGGDAISYAHFIVFINFNPHLRVGGDIFESHLRFSPQISIHTSA